MKYFFSLCVAGIFSVAQATPIKIVIIDLPALFARSEYSMASDIGYMTALTNLLRASKAPARVFQFIQQAFPEYPAPQGLAACDPSSGLLLPGVMQDMMRGKMPISFIATEGPERMSRLHGFESESERDFIKQIVRCMATPAILCKIFSPIKERSDALKEIKKKYPGINIVMACNFDTASYALLRKLHPTTLDIFQQHFVSGAMGHLMQETPFWSYLQANAMPGNAAPAQILVVTCDAATQQLCKKLGYQTVLVRPHEADGVFTRGTVKKLLG